MPPLSSIEVAGDPRYVGVDEHDKTRSVMIWPMSLNVNVRGKTLAEHTVRCPPFHAVHM